MEDIRKQAATHLAEIKGHDSNWTKQVYVYEQDLGMIEKHLLQQDDSFEIEMQQIQTRIEEWEEACIVIGRYEEIRKYHIIHVRNLKGTGQQKEKMDGHRKPVLEQKDGPAV